MSGKLKARALLLRLKKNDRDWYDSIIDQYNIENEDDVDILPFWELDDLIEDVRCALEELG